MIGAERAHEDPTKNGFWNRPSLGPWNQDVGSVCLSEIGGRKMRPHGRGRVV